MRRYRNQFYIIEAMTEDEARQVLLFHSGLHGEGEPAPSSNGLMDRLYPAHSSIVIEESTIHEIMEAIYILATSLCESQCDKELVTAVWYMCYFARRWGVDEDGMLRRSKSITDEDSKQLGKWLNDIEYAFITCLQTTDV